MAVSNKNSERQEPQQQKVRGTVVAKTKKTLTASNGKEG